MESWVEEIENDLKIIPKINMLKSNVSPSISGLDKLGREVLKIKLVDQLNYLWAVCHYSAKQKKAFEHIHKNLHKDITETKILVFYDIEIKNLKQYYENNKQIFELLELYKQQLNQIVEMKSTLSESEKVVLVNKFSDTEKRLKKLETVYKLLNGKDFYTHGKTISQYIESVTKEKNI